MGRAVSSWIFDSELEGLTLTRNTPHHTTLKQTNFTMAEAAAGEWPVEGAICNLHTND